MSNLVSGSGVIDDGKRAAVDPDGASLVDNGGTLRTSPSILSKKSGSPRNYQIGSDDGDDAVMTETEVSNLVNKALRRARKSTSPRKSPRSSPFAEKTDDSSTIQLEPVAKSPQRERQFSSAQQGPLSPCEDFHELLVPSNDSFSLAPKSSHDDSTAGGSAGGKTHMSASDAIIRRVEEEIANARKAAEAASLRLTSALASGSRDTSSIRDWRTSNDSRDWEQQDGAVITMRPSMDINDILNDHLADDEDFRVVLDSAFADDDNLAYYGAYDTQGASDEFAATAEASSEPLETADVSADQNKRPSVLVSDQNKEDDNPAESNTTVEDVPDDEMSQEDENTEAKASERDHSEEDNVREVKAAEPEEGSSNDEGANEQGIETVVSGDVSVLSSNGAQVSETSEDQVFMQKSATSGDAVSSGEDFAAESYETAEEDLPFPMDSDKGTSKTDEETSPTTESKALAEAECDDIELDETPEDGIPDPNGDNKNHPAIGSEIILSSQNMDPNASQVDNDDASEYTEETISDEESDYTEVTIQDAEAGDLSGKSVDEMKSDDEADEVQDQPRDGVQDRELLVRSEPMNAQISEPAIPASVEISKHGETFVEKPVSCQEQVSDMIFEERNNYVADKLETARYEVEKPALLYTPVDSLPIPSKAAPRRVTLSIVTQPSENESEDKSKRDDTHKLEGKEKTKEEKTKRARVTFRAPYPPPPPFPRRRGDEEIISEYREPIPEANKIWLRPKTELKQLLLAAMGASLPRRSNACGALKVLSTKTKKNKLTLVKTDGFLSALVFAIREDIPIKDRDVALDSRSRAVSTLLNVVEPKENRTVVFGYPGLAEALVKVIKEDKAEARVHACHAFAILAKTAACREQMPKIEGLIDVLSKVVQKTIDTNSYGQNEEEKKDESFDEDDGNHGSSSFSDDGSTDRSDDEESHTEGESSDESSAPPKNGTSARMQSIRKKKNDQLAEFSAQARISACAALSHLSKHCSISSQLCANQALIECLVVVSGEFENPIHSKCVEMITNLTRFPANNEVMAQQPRLLEALVKCGKSKVLSDRVWALRAFQNMSADPYSKVTLASSTILTLLSVCAVRRDYEERIPAVAALFNISTEPGAVVPLTNTRNVVATLVHLAHNAESSPEIRHMACDSLATIGLWLQTLAGTGSYPEGVRKVPLPSHATTGWQIWN